MKYLLIALSFVALPVFAADSVSINSITAIADASATISGNSFYDTTGTTTITLSTGATRENYGTSWSYTFPLNAGRYTVSATNGNTISREFAVSSGGGSLICPAHQPDCGMPMSWQKLMDSQPPIAPTEKPVNAMTQTELKAQIEVLIKQVIALLVQRVQELQKLLELQTVH